MSVINKKIAKRSIILITIMLSTVVWAGVYKWVDENGATHFSDKVPAGKNEIVAEKNIKILDQSNDHSLTKADQDALKEAEAAFSAHEYTKALALLMPLAEQGNPRAQNGLGRLYGLGLGVPININEGFRWHKKAAEQGYGLAQYYLGLMYADGQGITKDAGEGTKWLRKAAEQGIPDAQFSLGEMYEKGEGVPTDSDQAAQWYRKAAEQGHAYAQHNLALMYASGEGLPRSLEDSFQWEQKAANQGDPHAQYGLGTLYAKGEGIPQNYNEAFKWIRKAAAQGFPLNFDFDSGWQMAHYAELPNQYGIIEFIREGDDIENWSALLTIQNFPPLWGGSTPDDALNKLKAVRENACPEVTTWNIISKDENSILYEWHAKPCLGWPDQHEIARIIYGKSNTAILHYVQKTNQLSVEQRAKWIKKFSDAK